MEARGSDINPVAVMIGKAMIEFPSKFREMGAVNPEARCSKTKAKSGIAEDVRYYGQWIRKRANHKIGEFYPKVSITNDMAEEREDLQPYVGQKLTVIAYLWARTVQSPDPIIKGVHVPLVKSFELSQKLKKKPKTWIEPIVDHQNNSYKFKVQLGEREIPKGTINRGVGECLFSRATIPGNYIKREARAGRMGTRLMAIVAEGKRECDAHLKIRIYSIKQDF